MDSKEMFHRSASRLAANIVNAEKVGDVLDVMTETVAAAPRFVARNLLIEAIDMALKDSAEAMVKLMASNSPNDIHPTIGLPVGDIIIKELTTRQKLEERRTELCAMNIPLPMAA
jgi:hypothetical protein